MGPQDVSPAARGSAGWGDTACSELLQPLNAPAPPCPPGVWHGHPRRLLGDVPELLSPGWRGWGTLLATDREGEAQKGPQLVLEGKEGLSHPYPGAAPSHASRGASPAHRRVPLLSLLVPLIAAAGGEGVSAGTRRSPHISPASSGPAEPLEIRVLLRCRASEELLQSSHPGHLPAPPAGSGAILHDFMSSFKFLCAAAARMGTPPHRVPPRLWRAALGCSSPQERLRSCDNQQQGQVPARWWHLRPPASICTIGAGASGINRDCQPGVGHAGDAGSLQPRSSRDPKGCGVPAATGQEGPESRRRFSVPHWTRLSLPPLRRCC